MNKTIELQQNEICSSQKRAMVRLGCWHTRIGASAAFLLVLAASIQLAISNGNKKFEDSPDRKLVTKFVDLVEAKNNTDAYDTLQQIEGRADIYTRYVSQQDVIRILHASPQNALSRRFAYDYLDAATDKSSSSAIIEQLDRDVAAVGLDPNSATVRAQLGDQAAYKGDFHGAVIEYRRSLAQKDNAIVRKKLALMLVGCEKHDPRFVAM